MPKRASLLDQKQEFFKTSTTKKPHPVNAFAGETKGQAVDLPVDRIKSDPNQPRKTFSEESIASLAASIQEKGLLQPISVRKVDDGLILVAGERRWRAHQHADIPKIGSFIINIDDPNEAFEISLIENLQREDLNPFEEAAGIAELMKRKKYRQRKVGEVTGRSESQVSRLLKLNKLPDDLKEKLAPAQVSRDHLFLIADQKTQEEMLQLADKVVNMKLTRAQARDVAKSAEEAPKHDPFIRELKRFEKILAKAHLDEKIFHLEGDDKKTASEILEAVSDLVAKAQQQLWNNS